RPDRRLEQRTGFRNCIASSPFLNPPLNGGWVFCFPPHAPQPSLMVNDGDQTMKTTAQSRNHDREMSNMQNRNTETEAHRTAPRSLLLAAFAAIYLIWGSTYLGIRFAVETI